MTRQVTRKWLLGSPLRVTQKCLKADSIMTRELGPKSLLWQFLISGHLRVNLPESLLSHFRVTLPTDNTFFEYNSLRILVRSGEKKKKSGPLFRTVCVFDSVTGRSHRTIRIHIRIARYNATKLTAFTATFAFL